MLVAWLATCWLINNLVCWNVRVQKRVWIAPTDLVIIIIIYYYAETALKHKIHSKKNNKTAELPQRWPRDALKIFESPWLRPRLLLSKFLMGFCSATVSSVRLCPSVTFKWNRGRVISTTRKLSCRKDDRAMCPIYECPQNFREFLTTPRLLFPKCLMGFSFDRSYESAYRILSS